MATILVAMPYLLPAKTVPTHHCDIVLIARVFFGVLLYHKYVKSGHKGSMVLFTSFSSSFKLYSHGALIINNVVNILGRNWKCTCWLRGHRVRFCSRYSSFKHCSLPNAILMYPNWSWGVFFDMTLSSFCLKCQVQFNALLLLAMQDLVLKTCTDHAT